jgi:ribosomal protein S18 acetylase RimI-like enzyme
MEQNNRTITIREISTAEQLKTVESLAWKIFPDTYRDLIPPEQIPYMMKLMYDQAVLGKEIAGGMKYALIADGETPIGYISWHTADDGGTKFMRLEKLYLDFSYHGRSIGNMGLRFVIEKAKQAGAAYISLNVHKRNLRAQNAYCRVGFYRWRSEKEAVGNGFFKDDYIMRCDLVSGQENPSPE